MIKFQAPSNIALLKYWGKSNPELNLPTTSSISMTLDALSTITSVEHSEQGDVFYLNKQLQDERETQKVSRFIDLFRIASGRNDFVVVRSENNFPTAAGLASSASGYGALAGALNRFFDLDLDFDTLSTFARKGSGSASRSLHGGFVLWDKGWDDLSSKATQIDTGNWDIQMIIILCNQRKKAISSRTLMEITKKQSLFYSAWVEETNRLIPNMKEAILTHDFSTVGTLAQRNAWQMHATLLGNQNPFTYLDARSFEALEILQQLKSEQIEIYETMDAGPNIKVLVQQRNIPPVLKALKTRFSPTELIVSGVGQKARELPNDSY